MDIIAKIEVALVNSISQNDSLRKEASDFLTSQCEPDPQFYLALLKIIGNPDPEKRQVQY